MSFAIDLDLLRYASDSDSPFHDRGREFLKSCMSRSELFCLGWPTVMGYLRIATHPAVFTRPLTPVEAAANMEALLCLPHVRCLSEEDGFWEIYREIIRVVPARSNLVPDAHLAALLRQHGVRSIYTHDRDFRKFDFLDVHDPLEE